MGQAGVAMPNNPGPDDRSLTVAEYAKQHKLHPTTVYRLVWADRLKSERFGRAIRIPADALPTRPS
jgi:excisionase family DNA binding protein